MTAKTQWIALQTIANKEVARIFRIWGQTILPPLITMTLYFIIFGGFLGSQINDMGGFRYVEFIAPGLIMMAVITNSFMNVVSSFFSSKFQKNIEEILVSPTSVPVIIIGYVAGGMARGLTVGLLLLCVSLFFAKLHIYNLAVIVAFVILTSMVFALAGLTNGIFAKKFDDVSIVPTFILWPLTYLGGVFYSISLLPPLWQKISLLNPIIYMVNGFRYGFLGISDSNVWVGLVMLCIVAATLFIVNWALLKKGIGIRN
jgi:ABC-2 type transport system permease protein